MFSLPLLHLLQVVVTGVETAILTAAVSFLVIQTLKAILSLFGVDLSSQATAITAVIVMVLVAFINGLLVQIPAPLVPFAEELQRLLDLLLAALGPLGIHFTFRYTLRGEKPKKIF